MPITITPITESDISGAIACIQQAFTDDPYNNWVFDRKTFSPARNSISLRIRCKWGMRNALFHVAKDTADPDKKVLGVAMWMPPKSMGEGQSWDEWTQGWLLWSRQVGMNAWWGRGGLNVKRYYVWKQRQAAAQAEIWDDPNGYYFCNIVTVLPSEQGKGIGKMLFQEVTAMADADGKKCYLESSRDEPNTKIYEKLGFRKVKEMECNDDGEMIKLYCMVRDPRGTAKSNT
ncbi:hypothetical protein MMC19_005345 [Ptychographa xylographoides]|nr:hypothetical protein [Ptychographa xylographoides]